MSSKRAADNHALDSIGVFEHRDKCGCGEDSIDYE
jgi:hypothetical protein